MGRASGRERMLAGLLGASHRYTFESLPRIAAEQAAHAGLDGLLIYLADLQEESLFLVTGKGLDANADPGDEPGEIPVSGTVPGRAFQHGEIVPAARDGAPAPRWWIPLLNGTERLGVLRVSTDLKGDLAVGLMRELAGAIAVLITAKRDVSDAHARLIRRRRMNVAAEMQWHLIPPRTFATDRVVISAVLEPAYEISGDAFDYGVSGETVHLSIFDAMGHDAASGLTANLAVAACRNHRRQATDLTGTAEHIEEVLCEQFEDRFATGILSVLDSSTGRLSWLTRGHHPPVIIRNGRTLRLECPPAPPMGLGLGISGTVCHDQLEPGDRLVLYTDGITEARSPEGREFGLDRFIDFLVRHEADGLPVPETLRRLIRHHLDYHDGHLNDDATVLLLEWHGPAPFHAGEAEALVGLP
ncbi:PP2C family protein-serine/threonine phosphatase [Spirillospora sp. NPDC029432]|uniref:PP2C family protein-serine/threonine phosphatase n=1 Tax=Spirillospora sp. NPDC029432 TaxID=3154599 RepID=UPI0034541AFF